MEKRTFEVTNEKGEKEIRQSYTKRESKVNWAVILALVGILLAVLALTLS